MMSRSAGAVDGLRRHAQQRSHDARAAIERALRDLRQRRQAINVNAVARQAGVSRKTVYNHTDLLDRIRNHRGQARLSSAEGATSEENPLAAALRNELAAQKSWYEAEIARLRTQVREREGELAAVRSELHQRLARFRSHLGEETATRPGNEMPPQKG